METRKIRRSYHPVTGSGVFLFVLCILIAIFYVLQISPEAAFSASKNVITEVVHITSDDGTTVYGLLYEPNPSVYQRPGVGVVVIHGVEGSLFTSVPGFLTPALAEKGYAALAINARHSLGLFPTSTFEQPVSDVRAAIKYMNGKGFDKIFLVGHSLGTFVTGFCAGTNPDPSVKALGLTGIPHVRLAASSKEQIGELAYNALVAQATAAVAAGKASTYLLFTWCSPTCSARAWTAKTFLNWRGPDSNARFDTVLNKIKVPIFMIHDPNDTSVVFGGPPRPKYSTSGKWVKEGATSSPRVDSFLTTPTPGQSSGDAHSFVGIEKETEVINITANWMIEVGLLPAKLK